MSHVTKWVMSLNESCHIWINFSHIDTNSRRPSNVTNPAKPWSISQSRVMSHMNEPCHILTPMPPRPAQHHEPRHVTYEETRHILIPMRPPNITSLVMSHINKLCHTWLPMPGAQATSRTQHSHGSCLSHESCHIWTSHMTYEWVMSRTNTRRSSNVTNRDKSHTNSHVTYWYPCAHATSRTQWCRI